MTAARHPARLLRAGATGARLWTLAVRFVLVFFLAKYLTPDDVGLYGVLVATIGFVIYALGLDLYTFTSREILTTERQGWRSQVSSHFGLLAVVGLIGIPFSVVIVFATGLSPWSVLPWFLVLAPTEHIGYEIDRILIAMSDQMKASILVLVRQGLLPTVVIPLFLFVPSSRTLVTVLQLWAAFNIVAVICGLALLIWKTRGGGQRLAIDFRWALRGARVALPFLLGTLALKAIFTADRQVVATFGSFAEAGVYTFGMSVAAGLTSVLAVSVHQFSYPKLVSAAHGNDKSNFDHRLGSLWKQSLVLVGAAVLGSIALAPLLTSLVGKQIYVEHQWMIPAAMAAIGAYNLSLVPHYALYAMRADKQIASVTFLSLIFFVLGTSITLLCGLSALLAAVIGVGAASMCLLVGKQLVVHRVYAPFFALDDGISKQHVERVS